MWDYHSLFLRIAILILSMVTSDISPCTTNIATNMHDQVNYVAVLLKKYVDIYFLRFILTLKIYETIYPWKEVRSPVVKTTYQH